MIFCGSFLKRCKETRSFKDVMNCPPFLRPTGVYGKRELWYNRWYERYKQTEHRSTTLITTLFGEPNTETKSLPVGSRSPSNGLSMRSPLNMALKLPTWKLGRTTMCTC